VTVLHIVRVDIWICGKETIHFHWAHNLDRGPLIKIYGRMFTHFRGNVNTQYSSAISYLVRDFLALSEYTLSPVLTTFYNGY
jgi:hypothetical protein